MREEHGALIGRAAAAVGVSIVLHLAVIAVGSSVLIGVLPPRDTEEAFPVIEIVAGAAPVSAAGVNARGAVPAVDRRGPAPPTGGARAASPAAGGGVASRVPSIGVPSASASLVEEAAASRPVPPSVGDDGAISTASPPPDVASAATALPPGDGGAADRAVVAVATQPGIDDGALGDLGAEATTSAPEPPGGVVTAHPEGSGVDAPGMAATETAVSGDPRVSLTRLDEVTRNPSVAAHAEGQPFVGRRDVFEFLLDHPDFATHVTRALRLARYRMWRTGDELFMDDGWGATGRVFVVHAASGTRVLYARGEFQSGLLPAISGEAVVTITYDARPAPDGRELLSANISSQLKIGGALGDLVVRVASSLATEKAARESHRLVRTFARVLQAVDEKPAALYASLLGRPDVPQRELEQFRVLLKLP